MNKSIISIPSTTVVDNKIPDVFLKGMNASKHNRKFARSQWRKSFADGTFRYRGKLPSTPSFRDFCCA